MYTLLQLLIYCWNCIFAGPAPGELAICAMFKNEAEWLNEWVVYHNQVLGVSHFYLYNNDSTDNYREVLQPFIDQGIVEVLEWNSGDETHKGDFKQDTSFITYQVGAYNDCLKRACGKFKWVAVIDLDEFIVPLKGVRSFYRYLLRAERKGWGSLRLHWKAFGTSDIYDLKPNERLIEKLTKRAKIRWQEIYKSIHQPEAIVHCHVHECDQIKDGFKTKKMGQAQINHYWARTEKFCLERRGLAKNDPFLTELNEVEDRTILQVR